MAELPELDPVVHAPVRLAVLSLLTGAEEAEFTYLRDAVGTSDGNLSIHLGKLEEAGYIAIVKAFENKKPRTRCRLTEKGRAALGTYVRNLKALLGKDLMKGRGT